MKAWKISTRLQWIIGLLGALLVGIGPWACKDWRHPMPP
jgi:hypothetical protein